MKTIHFYGYLAEKYGKVLKFEVNTIQELMKAMKANFRDWEATIRHDEFEVVVGKDLDANHLSENELQLQFYTDDFHIAPVTEGRKSDSVFNIIIGVVLIAIGVVLLFTPFAPASPYFFAAGGSMVLGGVVQLIMGSPGLNGRDYTDREEVDKRPSFLFKGGVNNTEQGGAVPLVYGRVMCGSTVISASIVNEAI